ncbi:MAG: flagellar biosynthesis regulator FlaF [Rhodobacteraceae bacterium]|nr:flagellar biosynthesis regulator FlaF [Paracoccaceae bacterium]
MNATQLARTAYAAPGAPARSGRSAEYDLFARVTRRLREALAEDTPGPAPRIAALARALHENQRLWTVLAADVADDGNGLPRELRARLFYLAEFTRVHSARVLRGEASAGVLVDINTAVMRGLAQREGAA